MTEGETSRRPTEFMCSPQERGEIAVAALCDCANGLGSGLSSGAAEASWMQQALHDGVPGLLKSEHFVHGLSEAECLRVKDVASSGITPRMLRNPSHVEVVALVARLFMVGNTHPSATSESSIAKGVVEQAVISLRHAEAPAALHSVQRVAKRIAKVMRLPGTLSWRAGIEMDDIHSLCCSHLFRAALLSQAYQILVPWALQSIKTLKKCGSVPEGIEGAVAALGTAKREWTEFADGHVQALLRELSLVAEHETDFVFPLERLQMFSLIGVIHGGAVLKLRDDRLFYIEPASDLNLDRRPPGEKPRWLEGDELGDGPSILGSEDFRGVLDAVKPIGDCRVLATWRGSPRTVAAAREQIPRVLGSAATTAVMAQNISEGMLELLVSPYYTSPEHSWRYANINESHHCLNIEVSPDEFPIAAWLILVLEESLHASDRSLAFVGNASRLLLDADDLLDHSPEHSFVCSVAAIETCLSSRGEGISAKLARSSARLVCPDIQLRARAEEMFRVLYDLRSRVVHGDPVTVTRREAVFMRFIASCVIYNVTGFAKAQMRMGGDCNQDGLQKFLGQKDVFSSAPIPGSTRCEYLVELLEDPERRLSRWIQITA